MIMIESGSPYSELMAQAIIKRENDGHNLILLTRRDELGLSQRQLAEKAGVHLLSVSNYENLVYFPTPEYAQKIANVLGLKPEEVFPEWLKLFVGIEELPVENTLEIPTSGVSPRLLRQAYETEPTIDLEESARRACLRSNFKTVLESLTERERMVLILRYGLEDGKDRTLEEVGSELGFSKERASQLEIKGFRKLRHPSKAERIKWALDEQPERSRDPRILLNGVINALDQEDFQRASSNLIEAEKFYSGGFSQEEKDLLDILKHFKGAYKWDIQSVKSLIDWYINCNPIEAETICVDKLLSVVGDLQEIWKFYIRIPDFFQQ